MTNDRPMSHEMSSLLRDVAMDLKPIVNQIESNPTPLTKDNYDKYLEVFKRGVKGDYNDNPANKGAAIILYLALLTMGANKDGAKHAFQLYTGAEITP